VSGQQSSITGEAGSACGSTSSKGSTDNKGHAATSDEREGGTESEDSIYDSSFEYVGTTRLVLTQCWCPGDLGAG